MQPCPAMHGTAFAALKIGQTAGLPAFCRSVCTAIEARAGGGGVQVAGFWGPRVPAEARATLGGPHRMWAARFTRTGASVQTTHEPKKERGGGPGMHCLTAASLVRGPSTGVSVSHIVRRNGTSGLVGHSLARFLSGFFLCPPPSPAHAQ